MKFIIKMIRSHHLILAIGILLLLSCTNQEKVDNFSISFHRISNPAIFYSLDFDADSIRMYILRNRYRFEDSLIFHLDQRFKLRRGSAQALSKAITVMDFDSTRMKGRQSTGGGGIVFNKIINQDTVSITCINPSRDQQEFEDEFKLLDIFFSLLNKTQMSPTCDSISKGLYSRYGDEVVINKLGDSPLEYEIFDAIRLETLARDSLVYISFMESLPKDKNVLVNVKFGWHYWITSIMSDNVYIYGNDRVEECIKEIQAFEKNQKYDPNDVRFIPDSKYFRNKQMYDFWIESRHKNEFLTREEVLEVIKKNER